jgi:glycosyltransferase involved in cell wall biosynthesis
MKIFMPHDSRSGQTGGGSTFVRNLKAGMPEDIHFVDSVDSADLLFIAGPTLCDRDTARLAKGQGKPIVLRLDNLAEDHRNRGTGIPRMRDFAEMADVVVYQSEWAKHICAPICGENGTVVYNGVDTKIFHPPEKKREDDLHVFIYVKYSRNECKRFEEAQALFREYSRVHKHSKLIIVGRYSDELIQYGFGFTNGEDIEYMGTLDPYQLAEQYRRADVMLFPSFGDACPNVVLEAMASGLPIVYHGWGGTIELVREQGVLLTYHDLESAATHMKHAIRLARDPKTWNVDPRKWVEERFTLERMCQEYAGVFRLACLSPEKIGGEVLR